VGFFWRVRGITLALVDSSRPCRGVEEHGVAEALFPGVRPGTIDDRFLRSC
jgi:hypothetical protein